MTDLALLQRWTERRDPQAFKQIVGRYASMVYATCLRILRNSSEAEDVTQECFEALALGRGAPSQHLGSWLHRVAVNRALDRIRAEQRRKTRETQFAAEQPGQAEPAWDDVYAHVDEAVAELPEEIRAPVVAHYLLGESHAEISASSGVPRRTVSHRIERGVELIGESLKKRGVHIASGALGGLMAANLASASALPVSLVAGLGKLALAQSANPGGAAGSSVASAAKLIGGVLAMKKIAAVIVVVAGAILAYWALKPGDSAPGSRPAEIQKASTEDAGSSQPKAQGGGEASKSVETQGAPLEAEAADSEAGVMAIRGSVVDAETGQGVAGAKVIATGARGNYRTESMTEVLTDDSGRFEIAGLHPGLYLVFKKPGPADYMSSLPEDMAELRLRDGETKEDVVLAARKGGSVSGTVTDEQGRPVAGVGLLLGSARNESFQGMKAALSQVQDSAETDASGRYEFRGVRPGKNCAVNATARGYTPARSAEFSLASPGDSKRVDFQLARGSAVAGSVVDRAGNSVPGIEITLEPDLEGRSHVDIIALMGLGHRISGLKTDADGRFSIEGLPGGAFHLFAGGITRSPYNRFEGGGTRVVVDGVGDVEGVVVRAYGLGRGEHWVAGHVFNPAGAAISGAQVDIVATQPPVDHFVMYTDEAGSFLFDGLASGGYMLVFTAAGYTQTLVNSPPLDADDLPVTLQSVANVSGRVIERETGRPVNAVRVSVARHNRPQRNLSEGLTWFCERFDAIREGVSAETATTAANGTFEMPGVEPGVVVLKAERVGYAAAYSEEFAIDADSPVEDVTIYLSRGATVEGAVVSTGGEPVEGASILVVEGRLADEGQRDAELRLVRATNLGQGSVDIRGISDAAGRFTVDGLAEGEYWIRALAAGYAPSLVATVPVSGSGGQAGLELVLDPGGSVEGRITQGGMPKPDIIVQATQEGIHADCPRVSTNPDGYYIIEHLQPGEHQIRAVDFQMPGNTGLQTADVEVESGKTVRQDFEYSGHTLRGTIAGLGNPAEWQVAILNIPEGVDSEAPPDLSIDWISLVVTTTPLNADGSYLVGNLGDGIYKLEVFQFQDEEVVPRGVWQTVAMSGEDLILDIQAP